jgi:two-component system, chemotaxis family, chemotaxis protein CheY
MRVLIADDQRSCGIALADMVRYCGHDVVAIVGSGLEAIQAYTLHKPDLVLMDHWMPRLNGVTASRHIIAKNPKARVVLLSAWSPLDGADESGAICFLPKPVELARLNATLLTLSQSVSFSGHNSELHMRPAELFDPTPEPSATSVVPIPQEIISPIETFPAETFPIAVHSPQDDVDPNKIVPLPVDPKTPKKPRRPGRRRRAC